MSGWFSCRRQHKIALFLTDLLSSKRACSSRGRDVALSLQRTIGESKSSGGSRAELTGGVTVAYQKGPIRFARPAAMRHAEHGRDAVRDGHDRGGVERYPRSLFKDVSPSPDETCWRGCPSSCDRYQLWPGRRQTPAD